MSDPNTPQQGGFDVQTPDIQLPELAQAAEIRDEVDVSFKFAFVGSGQGGSRLAETFYKLGYRRVAVINTADQDLASIEVPNKLCFGQGGAGKDPKVAQALYQSREEDVLEFLRNSFGEVFDRVFVTVGAGGGTGAGTASSVVNTVHKLQVALKLPSTPVGVIVALPKYSEGKKVNANACVTLNGMLELVENRVVSPLVILDNERISTIYPKVAVNNFWETANRSVASLIHLFNSISRQSSSFTSFDANDFKSILDSGLIVFGATPVSNWSDRDSIAKAIRDNLKRTILSGGVQLSTGTIAACVMIAGSGILNSMPQETLDAAFDQLNRLLKPGSMVHRGLYRGDKESFTVFTAIGGLSKPDEKLRELAKLGDLVVHPS